MFANNFESLVPGLAEMRARERQARALGFAGLSNTVCGVEILCLTPKHRLELQLLRNAFTVVGANPLQGDVFQILWLLSPDRAPGSGRASSRVRFKRWRLRRAVRRLDLAAAIAEIYGFLAVQLQDTPEGNGQNAGTDHSPWVHWAALDATFWISIHGGFTLPTYLETPYVVLQQLYRAWKCHHPNVSVESDGRTTTIDPSFINGSDQLILRWQRQHQAEVAAFIRGKRERAD